MDDRKTLCSEKRKESKFSDCGRDEGRVLQDETRCCQEKKIVWKKGTVLCEERLKAFSLARLHSPSIMRPVLLFTSLAHSHPSDLYQV